MAKVCETRRRENKNERSEFLKPENFFNKNKQVTSGCERFIWRIYLETTS